MNHQHYQPGDELEATDDGTLTIHKLGPRLPNPVLPAGTLGTVEEIPIRTIELPADIQARLAEVLPDPSKTCTVKWDFENPLLPVYVDVPWEFIEFT